MQPDLTTTLEEDTNESSALFECIVANPLASLSSSRVRVSPNLVPPAISTSPPGNARALGVSQPAVPWKEVGAENTNETPLEGTISRGDALWKQHKVEASRGASGGLNNLARGSSMPTMLIKPAPPHSAIAESLGVEAGADGPREKDDSPRAAGTLSRTRSEGWGLLASAKEGMRGRSCLRPPGSQCVPLFLPTLPWVLERFRCIRRGGTDPSSGVCLRLHSLVSPGLGLTSRVSPSPFPLHSRRMCTAYSPCQYVNHPSTQVGYIHI